MTSKLTKEDFVEPLPPGKTYSECPRFSISKSTGAKVGAIIFAGIPLYSLLLVTGGAFFCCSSLRYSLSILILCLVYASSCIIFLNSFIALTSPLFAFASKAALTIKRLVISSSGSSSRFSPSAASKSQSSGVLAGLLSSNSISCFMFFLRRRLSPDFLPPFEPHSLASLSLRLLNGIKFFSLGNHLTTIF